MFLQPASQGQGTGSSLLVDLVARAPPGQQAVEAGRGQDQPRAPYQRFGFIVTSEDDFKCYMEQRPD
jgi:hypothetical protein